MNSNTWLTTNRIRREPHSLPVIPMNLNDKMKRVKVSWTILVILHNSETQKKKDKYCFRATTMFSYKINM